MTSNRQGHTNGRTFRVSRDSISRIKSHAPRQSKTFVGRPPALTVDQAAELATLIALNKLVRKHCSLTALIKRYGISATSIRTYSLRQHVHFKPTIGTIAAALEVHFSSRDPRPRLTATARAHHS